MKFNFRKISAIATSVLLAGMTMGVAAAANYPAPFVSGGVANVAIVQGTGTGVSALDQTQALNINLDLQSKVGGSGGSSGTVSGGDSVLLAKSSDNINIRDTWSGVYTGTIDDSELATLLADGTYIAADNDEFNFEQKITIGAPTLSHFQDDDYESAAGVTENTPTVGFNISDDTWVMNYTLDFTQDAESDIATDEVEDIEGSTITLLGKSYYVSDLKNGTNTGWFGKLTLLDAAEVGSVGEGETVTIAGHEISLDYIDSDEVKFMVDGVIVPGNNKLSQGGSSKLANGDYIGVRDISKLEVSGESGTVSFSIGSGKLEITAATDILLNDESIEGMKAWVHRGTANANAEKISKIEIEWKTNDDVFLTPELELVMPGFEAAKFSMGAFIRPTEEKITVKKDTDTTVKLTAPIKDGEMSIHLLFANSTGDFLGIGKDNQTQLATSENTSLYYLERNANGDKQHAYFIATYNTTTDSESYLLKAKITEDGTNGRNETTIWRYVDGAWSDTHGCKERAVADTCDFGSVTLTVDALEYKSGGNRTVVLSGGTNVNFHTLYTPGGLGIYLPMNSTANNSQGAINFTYNQTGLLAAGVSSQQGHGFDSFWLIMDGENREDTLESGTAFNVVIDDTSNNKLEISQVLSSGTGIGSGTGGYEGKEVGDNTEIYETYVRDDVSPRILHYTNPDEDWVEIYYPSGDSESYAEVYLTEAGAMVTGGSAGTSGSSTQIGNVIVKDSEVSSVSTKNLIIVGGSCINSAAATALGMSGATCGADFTTATGVGSGQFLIKGVSGVYSAGKIALVVAGYEAADTVAATTYLTTQTVDTSKAYKGTSSTSATLIVE